MEVMTVAAVTLLVRDLHGGKAAGVDNICLEMLKAMDVTGVTWLIFLFGVA